MKFNKKRGGPPGSFEFQEEPITSNVSKEVQQEKEEFQENLTELVLKKSDG